MDPILYLLVIDKGACLTDLQHTFFGNLYFISNKLYAYIGNSVALSEDASILAVGSPGDNNGNGGVFVFRYNGSGYEEMDLLKGTGNLGPARQGENDFS